MEYVLRLQNVRHHYNGKTVLDIPELRIPRGSITGLAGPNGSGKSTMLKILSLVEKCSSGAVYYENEEILTSTNGIRQLLTFLPQEAYLLKRSVYDNISYGLKIRGQKNKLKTSVAEALELVGLSPSFADRQWHELSGGETQRVALAARLILKPACLMLDEPTASVDMESARNIRRAILLARKEWGTTLVIASHHQSWINDICDSLVYLYNGRILDYSYKNVLLGPWEKLSDKLFGAKLADGQFLHVSRPPRPESSGVIPPQSIRISSTPPQKNKPMISGLVTGIFADNQPDTFCIETVCGDQQFIVNIAESTFLQENIRPGRKIYLLYNPEDIIWLS
ncbi:MAG: ATP-binding cassette domain-containing protein [Pseudomonadota bacterium]